MGHRFRDAIDVSLDKIEKAKIAGVKNAVKDVAQMAKEEISDKAVEDYYNEYSPKKYERKNKLDKAFWFEGGYNSEGLYLNMKYDSALMGSHKSKSWYHKSGGDWVSRYSEGFDYGSSSNGTPDGAWILTNFLRGIHPIYVLNRETNVVANLSVVKTPGLYRMSVYAREYEQTTGKLIVLKSIRKELLKLK